MNWGLITQLGVGGTFALLVIREVLNFLSKRNNRPGNPGNSPAVLAEKLDNLATAVNGVAASNADILEKLNEQTTTLVRIFDAVKQ